MNQIIKSTPEAPESNAGDDFHVLWTVKRSFELLNFEKKGLKLITIEGIDPKSSSKLDPLGNQLLGIDIAEYYGGDRFEDASKVIISQLKYSTRRINDNWTFSSLYKGKKKGSNDGSVFHRLAQIFKRYTDIHGRNLTLAKIALKLVSNREFSPQNKKLIRNIQVYLSKNNSPTYIGTVYKQFPKYEIVLKKIHTTTKLSSVEFTDFIRLLDFEDCGTASSYNQELEIVGALKNVGIQGTNQNNSLFRMVWRKMLPDAINCGQNTITEFDLFHCLDINKERLFPVLQRFEKNKNLVKRKQVKDIIEDIKKCNSGKPICIHGVAGIGKSTISQLIQKEFDKESEVILFDCYGEGMYLNPSDNRHAHKEAIPHVCNILAKKIGTPFFLYSESDPYLLVRELKNRISLAVKLLQTRNPNSLLVLIIDAADNSVTAAEKNQTKSFVNDLINENFPEGFRLVITSRTYRVPTLFLPNSYEEIILKPFNQEETKTLLKFHFPETTNKESIEFLKYTGGIPRVQSYAINLKNEGINEVINYLKPNGKNVEDLIEERINEASIKLGEKNKHMLTSFFECLISLPRPIPLSYITNLTKISKEILQDISTDIWYGLVLDDDKISFRDEDFENYIRQQYIPQKNLKERIANLLLEKANETEYASVNLGVALFDANYIEKLKNIVIDEEFRKEPVDPIRSKEVYIERTKLAMKACRTKEDNLTFFKLLTIAANVSKTDEALKGLLRDNISLVASFSEDDKLQRIINESEGKSWVGSMHYELAVVHSRDCKSKKLAETHLRSAEKWVSWLMQQKNDIEFKQYRITNLDIANGAEAILRLYGSKAAVKWLKRWSPKESVYNAVILLLDNILLFSEKPQISEWLKDLKIPVYLKVIIIDKLKISDTDLFNMNEIALNLARVVSKIKFNVYIQSSIITFCEYFSTNYPSQKDLIIDIIDKIKVKLPDYVPHLMDSSFRNDDEKAIVDLFLRKHSLKALLCKSPLQIENIYPEKYQNLDKLTDYKRRESRLRDKKEFDRFYKYAIEVYELRIEATLYGSERNLISKFNSITKKIKSDWDFRYYDSHWVKYKLNFLALTLIDVPQVIKDSEKFIETIFDSFENKNENKIDLRIAIAKKNSTNNVLKNYTHKILNDVDSLISDSSLPSSDRVRYYIECSHISLGQDKYLSRYYFEKAVEAVSEVDIEAFEQIKCLHKLTLVGIPNENPKLAFEFARFVEFCESRLSGYDHFPLEDGLRGVANLDCATSFSVICRWDHRYVANINEQMLLILTNSIKNGFIDSSIGNSMLPLNIYYWKTYVEFVKLIITDCNKYSNYTLKNRCIEDIIHDIAINCSSSELGYTVGTLWKEIEDGQFLDQKQVTKFDNYSSFIADHIDSKKNNIPSTRKIEEDKNTHTKISLLQEGLDYTSLSELSKAINVLQSNESDRNYRPSVRLLDEIKDCCPPEKYIQHLDALVDIEVDLLSFYEFSEAIKGRIMKWGYHPLVRKWMKLNFEKILRLRFSEFWWDDEIAYGRIKKFADIFSIEKNELVNIIQEILPDKLEKLSATAFYQTISFLNQLLTKEENEKLISWILPKWNSKIKDEFADGIWCENKIPSRSSTEVISQTIRYTLGHPDKRVRWRGIHSLRRLIYSGNDDILNYLLDRQNNRVCHPFQNKKYTFYWISSKLYLWLCIEKISFQNPELIIRFKNELILELQNTELPHVLIQYFIKATCLNLRKYDGKLFSTKENKVIDGILESNFKPVKEERLKRQQRKYKSDESEWKFKFDSMDTLPYWYRHLGNCYNLSEYDVADLAEKYIVEKWGFTGDVYKDDHIETSSDNDYYLTQNGHGENPTIENLRTYYEYHAMFCAANDLLQSEPLLDVDSNSYGSWKYWIESQVYTWKNFWLSDLKDPVPMVNYFWNSEFNKFDEEWRDNIEDKSFDSVLHLFSNENNDKINPYAKFTRYFGDNTETISIDSAIVTPNTSESLLRAAQTANDPYTYIIPLEGDDIQLDNTEFQLRGWLKSVGSDYEGLDKHDPFANDVCKNYIVMGKEVSDNFEIEFDDNNKTTILGSNIISHYITWSNITGKSLLTSDNLFPVFIIKCSS
jgi:hypothetical protein